MSAVIRKDINKISSYVAGKPIEEVKRQLGLKKVIKLASNENPLGASPKALNCIKSALSGINRYPDSSGYYLKRKIAKLYNLSADEIILGNGSDELIDIIIKAFCEPQDNIITADTTFLEYSIISQINRIKVYTAGLKYFKYDLDAIKKKIDRYTKIIFVANPNNPTGTYVTKYELNDFLKDLPQGVIVVLDEAYDSFIDVDDFPESLRLLNSKNLILLKTFSKAYGLAGLRIGYALCRKDFAFAMEKVRQPFNVNILALQAAACALDDKKFLKKTRQTILGGKNYLYDCLSKMGYPYVPSVANFILIDVGQDSQEFFKKMLKFGVIVRDMKQYGLKNFIRVTIGTKKENERFIKVLRKVS